LRCNSLTISGSRRDQDKVGGAKKKEEVHRAEDANIRRYRAQRRFEAVRAVRCADNLGQQAEFNVISIKADL
jgi:hypothetical protein